MPPVLHLVPAGTLPSYPFQNDDIMLAALVVGLVACAVFVWLNLPPLMADG